MKLDAVRKFLSAPTADAIESLLENEDIVFWIDWRQEDETIVESCELTLKTGTFEAHFIENTGDDAEYHIDIVCNNRRKRVPLTYSEADRHLTILTMNQVLHPEYEVRFCIDSDGGDTLGFIGLSCADWNQLESEFQGSVSQHFYRIAEKPNLFTDPTSFT